MYFRVKISINQLSPGFYPTLYLKQLGFAARPASLAALPFPSIVDYQMEFGGNPFALLTKTKFEYTFTGVSSQYWSLYTMALYQHTWGLTDMRKSEYEIMVQADAISKADYDSDRQGSSSRPVVSSSREALVEAAPAQEPASALEESSSGLQSTEGEQVVHEASLETQPIVPAAPESTPSSPALSQESQQPQPSLGSDGGI